MMKLKKRTFLILMAALTATFASAQKQPLPEWQSQYAVGLNKLAPHTYVWPYADASDIEKPGGYEQSPYYMSLNGKWKFNWVKNPDNRPKDFYQPSYYTGGWADINVPGNWERCSTSRRIRRWFHLPRTKSVPIAARLKCLPPGKDVG